MSPLSLDRGSTGARQLKDHRNGYKGLRMLHTLLATLSTAHEIRDPSRIPLFQNSSTRSRSLPHSPTPCRSPRETSEPAPNVLNHHPQVALRVLRVRPERQMPGHAATDVFPDGRRGGRLRRGRRDMCKLLPRVHGQAGGGAGGHQSRETDG